MIFCFLAFNYFKCCYICLSKYFLPKFSNMNEDTKTPFNPSRRSFLLKGSAAAMGLIMASPSAWTMPLSVPKKPNSKFFGVQVGVITYSYRSMPGYHDIKQILQYIVNSNINAVELMGEAPEEYAGKPANKEEVADWRAHEIGRASS